MPKAKSCRRELTGAYWAPMDLLNQRYMWAACIWGAIGAGCLIYGWRQRALIPFIGGLVMSAACFLSALWMSVACLATLFAIWWLLKKGY